MLVSNRDMAITDAYSHYFIVDLFKMCDDRVKYHQVHCTTIDCVGFLSVCLVCLDAFSDKGS